jgi:hypothetical protein
VHRFTGLVLGLAILLFLEAARADDPRVVILLPSGPRAQEQEHRLAQLRAELLASGFEVMEQALDTPIRVESLEAVARDTESFAAITLVDTGARVAADVWVTDRVTGKTLIRRLTGDGTGEPGARVLALRTVELLRASRLELERRRASEPDPAPEPVPEPPEEGRALPETHDEATPDPAQAPQAPAEVPSESTPSHFGVTGGIALLGGPGGLAPALAPAASLQWYGIPDWPLDLVVMAPGLGSVSARSASASIHQEAALLRLRYDPASPGAAWSGYVAGGAGLYHLGASGNESSRFESRSAGRFAFLAGTGLGARRHLFAGASLVGEIAAAWVTPRPVIRFGGERIGATGLPLMTLTLAWELRW